MAAQFGGKQYVEGQKEPIMKMPSDFMDFIRVLIPMSGSDNAMEGEQINKYGNHVGSWNIGLTGYVQDWRIKAYYEHFFEDESQMFFGYGPWKDGLLGVEVTLPEINSLMPLYMNVWAAKPDRTYLLRRFPGRI